MQPFPRTLEVYLCIFSSDQDHLSVKIMQMGFSNKPCWTSPLLISSSQIIQRKIHSHTNSNIWKGFSPFTLWHLSLRAISTSSMQASRIHSSTKPSDNLNRILHLLTCFEASNSSLFWLRIQNYKLPIKKKKSTISTCMCSMPVTIYTVQNLHMVSPKNWVIFSRNEHSNIWKLVCVPFPINTAADPVRDTASPYKAFVLFIFSEQHSYSNSAHNLQNHLCVYLIAIHLCTYLLLGIVAGTRDLSITE